MALKKIGQKKQEEEQPKKKPAPAPDPEPEEQEQEADEEEDSYANEVVTGSEAKTLSRGRNELAALGTYKFRVTDINWYKPSPAKDMPGRCEFTLEVLEGPGDDPDDGWPSIKTSVFVRFPKTGSDGKPFAKTAKQKQREEISEAEGWRFLSACLGEYDDSAEYTRSELAAECVGCEVLADNIASKDGQYKNLRNWRTE